MMFYCFEGVVALGGIGLAILEKASRRSKSRSWKMEEAKPRETKQEAT